MMTSRFLKMFLVLFLSFIAKYSYTQAVGVNTLVNPPYSPYLSEYTNLRNKVVITLNNNQNNTKQVYLKARFFNDNGFLAQTVENYKPLNPIILSPNAMYQLPANGELYEFFNEENIEVNNGDLEVAELLADGILPEGSYSLCIDVYDFVTDQQLNVANVGCGQIIIQYLNAPQLIYPSCDNGEQLFSIPQSYSFSWTPVNHNKPIKYDLYIVKLLEGDVPQDVIENAIDNGGNNAIWVKNISINSINYNLQHPVLAEGYYAWAVVAKVVNGNYPIANNGLSSVCTFTLSSQNQQNNQINQNDEPNVDCSCKLPLPADMVNAVDLTVGSIIKTSHFDMEVQSFQKNGNLYSGTGFIPLPLVNAKLIKAKVVFTDIEIKKSGNNLIHASGIIKANVNPSATPFLPKPDINDPGGISIGQNEMANLSDFVKNNAEQKISWIKNAANSFAFSVPIGFDEKAISVIITDITFTPEQGYFEAAAVVDVLDANSKFALLGKGICIDKNDLCGDVKLMLAKNFEIPVIGLTLLGGINDNKATSITIDKEGFKNLHIGAKYTFPAGSLIDKNTNGPATVLMQSDTEEGWNDWVAEVEFSTFYISGFDEFSFGPDKNGTKMHYDHSDLRNPQNIPSPYKSSDVNDPPIATDLLTWRGFYIPAIQINLPGCFNNSTTKTPTTVLAERLIFDQGLSGNVSVNNILAVGDGSLDSWFFSIDQFKIDLWKSTFKSSSLKGKIVLPLSHDYENTSNQLDYTCTLSKPANQNLGFSFEIEPKADIAFDIFWAKARLIQGTSITIEKRGGQDFLAKAALFGKLDIIPDIKDIPNIKLAGLRFENLRVQSQSEYFAYDDVQFATASPQHSIAGFTIDLDPTQGRGISLYVDQADRLKVGINFKALLKLADADFVPKADVAFKVYGKIGLKNGRPDWQGIDAELNSIKLNAGSKIGPVGVDGTIGYFNDNKGSYGFMGELHMEIIKIDVNAKAQFGYKSEGNGGYNYFFIDGMVDFSPGRISLGTGLAMYGFGGGVYYNMTQAAQTYSGDKITGTQKYDPNDVSAFKSLSGIVYTPSPDVFGIKASVLVGAENRNTFDADGGLTMEFNTLTGGVKYITFSMDGRFIVNENDPLIRRNQDCMGKLDVKMKMNFVEESFIFHAGIEFGVPNHSQKILLGASAKLDFFAGPTGWFIHVGRPWKTGNLEGGDPIRIDVLEIAKFKAYMQCGSGSGNAFRDGIEVNGIAAVDRMPPIPTFIMNIINGNHQGEEGSYANSDNLNSYQRGAIEGGLAFGANFDQKLDVKFAIFYLYARIMVGFDVGFYKLQANAALCRNENGQTQTKGINGFYAKGQAYIGAQMDVGVHIDLFFIEADISIVEAGAAAYLEMGMPSPTYFKGALGGYFSVLGGLISGNFSIPFFIGEKCTDIVSEAIPLIASVTPETDFDLKKLDSTYDAKDLQEVYVQPTFTFNYKIDETFLIKIPVPDPDNEGQNYTEYRYYHILPSDLTLWLGGHEKNALNRYGGIWENTILSKTALHIGNFKVSNDGYSLIPKANLLFEKESRFRAELTAKVRIFNLGINSKGANKNYTNQDRNAWKLAGDEKDNVYVDKRLFTFTTNCGIKEIKEEWVSDLYPFHRTQNNPYGSSTPLNDSEFRKASQDNTFSVVYKAPSKYAKVFNTNINFINQENPEYPILYLSAAATGGNITGSFMFDESVLCIPNDFKGNFDFALRVMSYDRRGNGESFHKEVYNTDINQNNKAEIRFQMPKNLPQNSYVIIQPIIKKKVNSNNPNLAANLFGSDFQVRKQYGDVKINNRVVPISSKMASNTSELVLFSWYFNTGDFVNYKEKMRGLRIEKGKPIIATEKFNLQGNKAGIKWENYEVEESMYRFYGNECFDYHDLNNFRLQDMFSGTAGYKPYNKMLEDGYLGYAFDNASQIVVDSFLKTYFDNFEVMQKYLGLNQANRDNELLNHRIFIKNYITDRMLDAVRDNVVSDNVLPFLDETPPNLIYSSTYGKIQRLGSDKLLFSINRLSKFLKSLGSGSKVFPAYIISMKDVIDFKPNNDGVIINAMKADGMHNFNMNIENKIYKNFKPNILNGI
ncbi:MAG: hypothetical protein IPO65_06840 [Saprospiraceae bacterium]|nr:hypothetical protein [Saprospiraceae bacterium]